MMSLGGIALPQPLPAHAAWVADHWRPHEVYEFADPSWPGNLARAAWGYQMPRANALRPVKLGSLYWPWGACRWACGHFAVTEAKLNQIRAYAYEQPGGYRALEFTIGDGVTPHALATNLWVLPARPLMTAVAGERLHLMTLVDDRYFWWQRAAEVVVTQGTTTWSQLFADIGTALGVTISPDPISAAYLKPAGDLTSRYQYLPMLLDAVAAAVGQRIVRKYNGAVVAQGAATALASADSQPAYGYAKVAGGTFDLRA